MNEHGIKDYTELQIYYRKKISAALKSDRIAIFWADEKIHILPDRP